MLLCKIELICIVCVLKKINKCICPKYIFSKKLFFLSSSDVDSWVTVFWDVSVENWMNGFKCLLGKIHRMAGKFNLDSFAKRFMKLNT
jgi:hypothetical protein